MNGEVSFETGETQLGGLSFAINETSHVNLDDGGKGREEEEVEMEEVVRTEDAACKKGQELGTGELEEVGNGGEIGKEEERRNDVPVIDVTTPSQDGSTEHLL